jgi:hypothetical protein
MNETTTSAADTADSAGGQTAAPAPLPKTFQVYLRRLASGGSYVFRIHAEDETAARAWVQRVLPGALEGELRDYGVWSRPGAAVLLRDCDVSRKCAFKNGRLTAVPAAPGEFRVSREEAAQELGRLVRRLYEDHDQFASSARHFVKEFEREKREPQLARAGRMLQMAQQVRRWLRGLHEEYLNALAALDVELPVQGELTAPRADQTP